ncbi:GNAT family N-acetyltransferase [Pseudoalteromonas sp. CR1]|uniref:GNAT family N-acetyltransferase n=1 Tax=unclassified Pseudoalteromonas TaxID=194690 RepID=UPI0007307ACC|nr:MULTISPECIES: GNAT family N-acetyltransferase [unclassified Pseudoalteromonas]KTD89414.1 GNAT family acetyltransferase [Pseudoalteromonas sp. H71]MBW4966231.1 GNAT family N-acetyltransferase [Pseudoalteromonas sp. CR1]
MYTTQLLDTVKTPLVNKFYKVHGVSGRANKQDQVWVIYLGTHIVAACRLQNKTTFLFLSTVYVAPEHRSKGVAKQLITDLLTHQHMHVYTFAFKNIADLYRSIGFNQVLTYTPEIHVLFDMYKHRNIVALEYP